MIDIVVPVYNEAGNIQRLLNEVSTKIKSEKEIIIVYDFEEDNTLPVLEKIKNKYSFSIKLERNAYGRGALNAIKTGLQKATHEAVLVIMADLSDSLEVVDEMYQKIATGNIDLVCGSRYMKGGKQYGGPFLKGLFSRTAGITLRLLTKMPTYDVTNSFKMYRKSMLNNIEIESNGGFEIGMEIAVKAYIRGYKISEVPTEWYDRTDGESNFKMWTWMPMYFHWYWLCIRKTWFKPCN